MSEPVSGSVGTPSQEGRPEMSQEAREDAWFGAYCEASALGGSGPRGRAVLMALADKEIAAALAAVVVSSPATPGRLDPLDPEPSCLVHFSGGPWHGQVIDVALTRVVAPVFAVGHPIGTHYWLDTKSDPPTYVWDGHPSPATPEVSRERDKPQVRELVARRLAQAEGKPFDLMSDWLRGVWLEEADSLLADIAASPATPNGQEEGAALLTHAWSGGRCRNCGCTETAPAATDPCISLAHPGDVDECPHGRHTHRYPGDCSCTCRFCRAAPSPASPAETREGARAETMRRLLDEIRSLLPDASPVLGPDPWGWAGYVSEEAMEVYGGPAEDGYRTGTVLRRSPDCEECGLPSAADIGLIVASVNYAALAAASPAAVPLPEETARAEETRKNRDWWKNAAMELAAEVGTKDRLILDALALCDAAEGRGIESGPPLTLTAIRAALTAAPSLPGEQPGGQDGRYAQADVAELHRSQIRGDEGHSWVEFTDGWHWCSCLSNYQHPPTQPGGQR